ncbi:peptidoglycan editing factor PgeF [Cetobacterium somerae]|uniref:Purine nucleoside phosphorylase n=1 Tax=Cetobacterium somerae ATCC BAA-474 TaxID=1319815 RepID=U7V5C2_9FUSO|nr:peptidoglycan editing factor PgeF [Cetobacterium somerae]ERT65963.1 hypothetical protein HMPREF0202_02718 [Cetobacterium somerae ATCC BAA-474]
MFIDKEFYYELDEFSKLGLKAIYTTKSFGDVKKEEDRNKINSILNIEDKKIYSGFQTHSSNIVVIDKETTTYSEDTDGFITKRDDVVIFTKYADCLPIYIYDSENGAFGCIHSGWVGSFENIGSKAIEMMIKEFNSKVKNIIVAFGIGISLENYEVSEDFYLKFKRKFNEKLLEKVFLKKESKYYFDNQKFNYNLMKEIGIQEKNIITNNLCTYRDNFHSYRREKEDSGRNGAYIFVDKNRKK